MTNKKFTLAAVAAAAIAAAPIISTSAAVFADPTGPNMAELAVERAKAAQANGASTADALAAATGGSQTTTAGTGTTQSTADTATIAVTGTVTVKRTSLLYKDASGQDTPVGSAVKGAVYAVTNQVTLGNGATYYEVAGGQFLSADDVDSSKVVSTADASKTTTTTKKTDATTKNIGVIKVNYNAKYGIQIWNKAGQVVKYNSVDAKAWNAKHSKKVKVGDAKKLPGQTTWKVFNATYKDHGTTYYNLGGDQYIDANYVKKIK
ncbi:SLAP domain-containing protein [Lacticaseibacillus zhaodongensis]|uniref:SLAP domain-containing protein n=1 Tax=Lacticaseibacillus zhaodongensis TaxID=2668065 RepID=UPI0012D32FE2|nr:SLAP domain-containing protein [Lacticaseibacillus zhaodongensis]